MAELLLVMVLVSLLFTVVFVYVNPNEARQKARDSKRITDIVVLEQAVNEYVLANKSYPGSLNTLRISNVLPVGSTSLQNADDGWIGADLSAFTSRMPTDPTNDATYHYSYYHNNTSFELNAKLEILTSEMTNDGGNDPNTYEVGNNLLLISP